MHRLTKSVTGAEAVGFTLAPGVAFELTEIRIHLSAVGAAANLTVKMDAIAGAAFDAIVITQDMTSVLDLFWQPDHPMFFNAGDELDFAWANGSTRTYGIEVIYEVY